MSKLTDTAVSLANLLLAVRYPFPLYISRIHWYECFPLRAALALAPQLQAAQANRMEDVYKTIIRSANIADALRDKFAPRRLCHSLSEQHLLSSLPVLACADFGLASIKDKQYFQDAFHAIRDRLGYAFFESAIHACVGKGQVSQDETILQCVHIVCYCFPEDLLPLAQRYGDVIIRLHNVESFLIMLDHWCKYQVRMSQEALVEVFDSPLTRAAAMILHHPNLSPIDSPNAVEAAFDALSLADRARLLLTRGRYSYNEHASSVERKLRLLGFDPSIQSAVCTSSDGENMGSDELLLRCLLHIPDPSSAHVVLEQVCKQSSDARYTLTTLGDKALRSDEARMRLAQVLTNASVALNDVVHRGEYAINKIRRLARSLPDASLGAALEARLAWAEQTYKLSWQCVSAVKNLIINRFGAQLERLKDSAGIAKVYDAMLQDRTWLETVDETIANIPGIHSLMSTMYDASSEPEQGI